MYNRAAVHVTTRLTWSELTRLTTFVSKITLLNRVRHGSLGVKTSNASPISCGSLLILLFFPKICQMVICPVRDTYNHTTYRYFFASSRMKKAFKFGSRASYSYIVICHSDGTYNHLTYVEKKMPEMRNSKQIFEFANRKCCLTFSGSKAFFVLEQRIKYGYVVI